MFTYGEKLKPVTAAEVTEAATIEGMRRRISKYSREDPMVREILMSAEYRGLSGDDKMTWLAYEALLDRERLRDMLIEDIKIYPSPRVITGPRY